MTKLISILAVAGLAASANAGIFQAAGPRFEGTPGANPMINEYQVDDGTAENSIGLTSGGNLAWVNRFTVTAGNEIITNIRVAFGTPLNINGLPVTAYLFSDPNNDGNPVDAQVLTSVAGVVSGANAAVPIANPTFVNFDITDTTLAVGQNFFVGVVMTQLASQFPAAIDQTAPNNGRSWVSFTATGTPFNPNAWPAANTFNVDNIGLAGDFLVRADATPIPAPGALALLGLGGLVAGRRRR